MTTQPMPHAVTTGQLEGGPLDGKEYDDVPLGGFGSPAYLLFIPIVSDDPSVGLRAVYRREIFDSEPWTYSFLQVNKVAPTLGGWQDDGSLPVGTSVQFTPEAQMAMELPPAFVPARRFVIAQSWWIGSELCRRHSRLRLYEMHPGGGQYDVLRVTPNVPGRDLMADRVDLNRAGRIHLSDHEAVTWAEALSMSSPHEVVRRAEQVRGWGSVGGADASTATSVTYRVVAALLRSRVDDRAAWDVRMDLSDSSLDGVGSNRFVEHFLPAAHWALQQAEERPSFTGPREHFWALLRDGEPTVLFDDAGRCFPRGAETVDLFAVYKRRRVLQDVLNDVEERIAQAG